MKKRILALVAAAVMTCAMSLTAFASNNAGNVASTSNPEAPVALGSQTITEASLTNYAAVANKNATGTVSNFTFSTVSTEVVKSLVAEVKNTIGETATIATVVDLQVPEGTGTGTFTLGGLNVVAGQNVTVLHQKSGGTWETIKPDKVENGSVTFTMTSYSPVAIVVNAAAPKTQDIVILVAGLAAACFAGSVAFGRKAR